MLPFHVNVQSLAADERWFLVHTLPKSEQRAAFHLGAQGFRSYYPRIEKTVRRYLDRSDWWKPLRDKVYNGERLGLVKA